MDDIRSIEVTVDGVRSPVLTSGVDSDSTAVVFIHGNPGSSHDFRGLLSAIGPYARCIAPDMPGFGQADKPLDFPQSAVGHARHLDGLLQQLGVERVHLVLHDFGGLWGMTWAAGHIDRVASVTLMNTGVVTEHKWHWPARLWITRGVGELVMRLTTPAAFKTILQHGHPLKPAPTALPREFLAHMATDFDTRTKDSVLRLYRHSEHMGAAGEMMGYSLRQFDLPALVIWGGRDHFLPVRHAYQQRAAFPSAEIVVIDEAGHWPMITHAARAEAAVRDFLRSHLTEPAIQR